MTDILKCARCYEDESCHTRPMGPDHDFMPGTDANHLRVWAKTQYVGESRKLMLRAADVLDVQAAQQQAIVDASNALLDVCSEDYEHIIECHADTLPEMYRAQAVASDKALQILQVEVHAMLDRGPQRRDGDWTQANDGDYWRHPSGALVLELSNNRGCPYWASNVPGDLAVGTAPTLAEAKRLALEAVPE